MFSRRELLWGKRGVIGFKVKHSSAGQPGIKATKSIAAPKPSA